MVRSVLPGHPAEAIGNDHHYDRHRGKQPGSLSLLLAGEQGDGDEQANTDQRVHGAFCGPPACCKGSIALTPCRGEVPRVRCQRRSAGTTRNGINPSTTLTSANANSKL